MPAAVVEQTLADAAPDRAGAVDPDRVIPPDLDDAQAAQTLDAQHLMADRAECASDAGRGVAAACGSDNTDCHQPLSTSIGSA